MGGRPTDCLNSRTKYDLSIPNRRDMVSRSRGVWMEACIMVNASSTYLTPWGAGEGPFPARSQRKARKR